MKRRAVLAAAGVVLAGCAGEDAGDATTSTAVSTTTTTTTTAATTTTTAETTEAATTTTERTTTEETTTTESSERRYARRRIEDARADLQAAFETYVGFAGPNAGFLDVTAATAPFHARSVVSDVESAQIHLSDAESQEIAEFDATIEALRDAGDLLRRAARTQSALASCHSEHRRALRQYYSGEDFKLEMTFESLGEKLQSARDTYREFESETEPGDLEAVAFLSATQYERKRAQFERERVALSFLHALYRDLHDAIETLNDGLAVLGKGTWNQSDFETVGSAFYDAYGDFEDAAYDLRTASLPATFADGELKLLCATEALARGSRKLDEMVQSAGNDQRVKAAKEDAAEAFAECPLVVEHYDKIWT